MRSLKSIKLLVIGASFLAVAAAMAATPKTITYQGRLTDAAGNPVADGPYTIDFRLYPVPVGGILLWSEPGVLVTTEKGLFTTDLGSPTPFPSGVYSVLHGPEDIFLHASELWLEIEVGGTILAPRTKLQSVPHAVSASNLAGRAASNPLVGIETSSEIGLIENYGNDGLNRFRIWGNNWGQVLLYDGSAFQGINLAANGGGGGSFRSAMVLAVMAYLCLEGGRAMVRSFFRPTPLTPRKFSTSRGLRLAGTQATRVSSPLIPPRILSH